MTIARAIEFERKRAFVLFRDLAAQSSKKWLVHRLLGDGEASAMYGKPGDGKSVLAEDLALHVAAGRFWHGRAIKQGAVVYIALERRKLVERRAIAFREKHGLNDLPFAVVGGVHDFRHPRIAIRMAEIVAEIEAELAQKVVLIVIDTLSRAMCGGDENSPKDMGAIVNSTGILQDRTGAHVLWVHHMPLDGGERMRGHGALLGALDTTLHVVKADTIRTATVVKANDSEEGEAIAFALESIVLGKDEDGNETTAPVVVPIEGPTPRPPVGFGRLSKAAQTALRALAEALEEQGAHAPASNHIPRGVKVVTYSVWRQQAYRRGISTSEEERAKQQAFKRASEYLIGAGKVGAWDGQAWITV
jgi:AAA domain